MPQAACDGISLFYKRHGAGEPVLLIQGMSGTHLAWGEAFMAGLGDDLDVVVYDHRGVGDSTPQTDQAETGWSQTMKLGLTARARATPIRCLCPPLNSWG